MRQQSYPRRDCEHSLNNLPPLPPPPSPIVEIPANPSQPPKPSSVAPMTNISSDISAPYPVRSKQGNHYYFLYQDMDTDYAMIVFGKTKD
jgi:hypothetical protein